MLGDNMRRTRVSGDRKLRVLVRSVVAAALGATTAWMPQVVWAESGGREIEEVIVTATRRQESLQDVPVSVGVVTDEMIKELALQNLDELAAYVPGLSIREGGEQTGISIRGFGSGLNFGFDQSVGLFIDGIYAGRERQFRNRFLDIGSVQVLRGPQSTLFGKNTISGAIIIDTANPSPEFGVDLKVEGATETDRRTVEAIVNGGLADDISARLALRWSQEDGYMYNTLTKEREEQQKDKIARLTLLWSPSDRLSVRTKLEVSSYNRIGRNFNVSNVSGLAVGEPMNGGADVSLAAQLPSYLAYDPKFHYDSFRLNSKQEETADVDSRNAAVKVVYEMDRGTLTSITGYSAYKSNDQRDVDWTPTTFLYEPIHQEFDQVSQEFQFASPSGQTFEYIAGVHVFRNNFFVDRRTDIDINVYLLPYGVLPFQIGAPWTVPPYADYYRYGDMRFLDQETKNVSVYYNGTYNFTDQLALTMGLRYAREDKTATDRFALSEYGKNRFLDLVNNQADIDLINGIRTVLGANINGIVLDSRVGSKKTVTESDWSPEATLSYDYNADMMFYFKVGQGHKGGGFNSATTGQNAKDRTFGDETVTGYELGGKLRVLDGSARINFALFRMDFKDLQTSTWVGDEFDVGNAGKARSQGLEADITWLATERLQVNANFIYMDATYIENRFNACSIPQRYFPNPEPGCVVLDPGPPIVYNQDLTGERFAPRWQGNGGVGYITPVSSGMELLLRADLVYYPKGEYPIDPTIVQDSWTNLDVAATLRSTNSTWSVGLLVQNARDHEGYWYEFEAPAQIGTRIGFPIAPRRVTLRAEYSF